MNPDESLPVHGTVVLYGVSRVLIDLTQRCPRRRYVARSKFTACDRAGQQRQARLNRDDLLSGGLIGECDVSGRDVVPFLQVACEVLLLRCETCVEQEDLFP